MIELKINGVITEHPQSMSEYVCMFDNLKDLEKNKQYLSASTIKSLDCLRISLNKFKRDNPNLFEKE